MNREVVIVDGPRQINEGETIDLREIMRSCLAEQATPSSTVGPLSERLACIEALVRQLVETSATKPHYSVEDFSGIVKRATFTVRQWCNQGRIQAHKSLTQTGSSPRWVISHQEYERFLREGLLPKHPRNL